MKKKSNLFKVGEVYESNTCGKFIILSNIENNQKYTIRFIDTGYETIVTYAQIYCRCIKDKFKPSIYGVGYLGGEISTADNSKLYRAWRAIIGSCYHKEHGSYKFHGAKGEKVCTRWHSFTNFIDDVSKMEGYDKYVNDPRYRLILKENIDSKVYGPDTCYIKDIDFIIDQKIKKSKTPVNRNGKLQVGTIHESSYSGKFKITRIIKSYQGPDHKLFEIEFLDTGYKTTVRAPQIYSKSIKDRLKPSVSGIGIIGYGDVVKNRKVYHIWHNMIRSAFCSAQKTPNGFKVYEKWLRFDLFLEDIKRMDNYEDLINTNCFMFCRINNCTYDRYGYNISDYTPLTCAIVDKEKYYEFSRMLQQRRA